MKNAWEELRTAQLAALQNQITPHYIVNSLDVIRMKLILDGQTETAELLESFQNSLKTYGFSPYDTISLADEFAFLEDCLLFQQFRFLGKLSWEFRLPEQISSWEIPRFLLQPLVENAVRHGLSGDMPKPHLQIEAWLEEDCLCLRVSDNGKGFSESEQATGIGIANVKERLRLLYRDGAWMEFKSIPGTGTSVTLRLPEKGGSRL